MNQTKKENVAVVNTDILINLIFDYKIYFIFNIIILLYRIIKLKNLFIYNLK